MENISIALASYNGEKYIQKQLDSILIQLSENDEIVISDDGSDDNTIEIVNQYCKADRRIKLINGPQSGFVNNFENAIQKCTNKYIFLCDQDDIWLKDKKKIVLKNLEIENVHLVMHDMDILTEKGVVCTSVFKRGKMHSVVKSLFYSTYVGCCMAFKKEFINKYIPFPKDVIAHDQWIGLCAEQEKSSVFIKEKLIQHRIHDLNVSKKVNIIGKIKFRKKMIESYYRYFR